MVPRARSFAVKRETVDKYALGLAGDIHPINLFREIRDAWSTRDLLSREIARPRLYGSDESKHNDTDVKVVEALWATRQEDPK